MTLREQFALRHTSVLEPLAVRLRDHIRELCAGLERIDSIAARAKGVERFLAKAAKKTTTGTPKYEDPLSQIQDQVGARIVTFYPKGVEVVAAQIVRHFRAVEE